MSGHPSRASRCFTVTIGFEKKRGSPYHLPTKPTQTDTSSFFPPLLENGVGFVSNIAKAPRSLCESLRDVSSRREIFDDVYDLVVDEMIHDKMLQLFSKHMIIHKEMFNLNQLNQLNHRDFVEDAK